MSKKLTSISRHLFSIGLIATAVLMPLDLITQGGLRVEWFVLFLLGQRLLVCLIIDRPFTKNIVDLIKSSVPFALPALAAVIATLIALNQAAAIPYLIVIIGLLGRGWLVSKFTTKVDIGLFEKTTLIMAGLLVAFGYFQFFGDVIGIPPTITALLSQYRSFTTFPFPRVHSLSLEPLYFSNYLLLPLSILIIRLRQKNTTKRQWQYGILFVVSLALLISSVSRSAILGLIVSGLIYLIAIRKDTAYIKHIAMLFAVSLILVSGLVYSVKVLPKIQFKSKANQAFSIFGTHITNLNEGSAKTRYELWPKAIELVKQHPVLGVGLNGSRGALHPDEVSTKKYDALQPLNNDYLMVVVEQGLLGILAFIPLLFIVFKIIFETIRRNYKNPSAPYVLTIIAVAVQINSFGGLSLLRTWVVFGMLIASWRLNQESKKLNERL